MDRFELEAQIMACWNIKEDLELLNENVLENRVTQDQISNSLAGLAQIYDMKFAKLFNTFEICIRTKQFND